MSSHISPNERSLNYHLRNIGRIRSYIDNRDFAGFFCLFVCLFVCLFFWVFFLFLFFVCFCVCVCV